MSRSDQAFHTHTGVELVHLEFKSESRGGLVAERSCPHLSLGVRKLTGPFHFIFVELSFVKWIVLPSVFSLAVKLIVDKLSLVQRAWRVGELAPPIHLVPFPLPLIHGPVRRGVDTVTVPLQWTVTTMLVFSIISVSIGEDVNPFGRGWGCFFFLLVFFICNEYSEAKIYPSIVWKKNFFFISEKKCSVISTKLEWLVELLLTLKID